MKKWILVLVIAMITVAAMGQSYLSVEGYGVEAQVDTMDCYFGVGTSAGERLTYDFDDPGSRASSNLVLKIDGQTYGFPTITPSVSFDIRDYRSDGYPRLLTATNTIQSRWEIDSSSHHVILNQFFTPETLDIARGVIRVRYEIENPGTTIVDVALEHKWDIMVGSSDGSTITIPGSFSDTNCVYTTSMPGLFIAPEIGLTDTIDQLVAMGVVNSMDATRPDLLAFGNEIDIIPSVFSIDTSFSGDTYSFSAVLIRWDTDTLSPGATCEIVTYYGLQQNMTGIAEENKLPGDFTLSAYPNPFNSAVTITAPAGAEIEIFDVNGHRVDVIARRATPDAAISPMAEKDCHDLRSRNDGASEFIWQPAPFLGSGVYLVRARFDNRSLSGAEASGSGTITKRIVYLK